MGALDLRVSLQCLSFGQKIGMQFYLLAFPAQREESSLRRAKAMAPEVDTFGASSISLCLILNLKIDMFLQWSEEHVILPAITGSSAAG